MKTEVGFSEYKPRPGSCNLEARQAYLKAVEEFLTETINEFYSELLVSYDELFVDAPEDHWGLLDD